MKPLFDPKQFDSLSGMALGRYAVEISQHGELPENFFDYFKANAGRWDGQHLEMALSLLRKINTEAARHEIAVHLNHPQKHIQLTVLGFIDGFERKDEYVLSKVEQRFQTSTDSFERSWLKDIQTKAGKATKTSAGLFARLFKQK